LGSLRLLQQPSQAENAKKQSPPLFRPFSRGGFCFGVSFDFIYKVMYYWVEKGAKR
jgi:hypothetical protein